MTWARRPRDLRGGQRRRGHDAPRAGLTDPLDPMPGLVRASDCTQLLLLLVAVGTEALPVVDAGGATQGMGNDVVLLADRRIAEGPAAGRVPQRQEPPQLLGEGARLGFHGDQLPGCRMRVQAP